MGNSRLAIIVSLVASVAEHKRRAARRPEFVNLEKDVWSSCRFRERLTAGTQTTPPFSRCYKLEVNTARLQSCCVRLCAVLAAFTGSSPLAGAGPGTDSSVPRQKRSTRLWRSAGSTAVGPHRQRDMHKLTDAKAGLALRPKRSRYEWIRDTLF